MPEYTDKELLKLFREKDTSYYAFNLIVRTYQERLYWHIRRIVTEHEDADDVLQNTFIKVWKALGQFREEAGLFTWLFKIATNESLTFLKKKKRKQLLSLRLEKEYKNQYVENSFFSGDEIQIKLQEAIHKLPRKQQLVFNMKYFDDIKYEEMSKILNTSVGALKASYHHAVKKIEKELGGD
ncbi:MAG TPA: sigma-70 family RNA polymerase sigma factor [Bacteroidales bacterium]|nr:sigma-70 family RNA polymerase sigma factor [Bacteroidales bacterium]